MHNKGLKRPTGKPKGALIKLRIGTLRKAFSRASRCLMDLLALCKITSTFRVVTSLCGCSAMVQNTVRIRPSDEVAN